MALPKSYILRLISLKFLKYSSHQLHYTNQISPSGAFSSLAKCFSLSLSLSIFLKLELIREFLRKSPFFTKMICDHVEFPSLRTTVFQSHISILRFLNTVSFCFFPLTSLKPTGLMGLVLSLCHYKLKELYLHHSKILVTTLSITSYSVLVRIISRVAIPYSIFLFSGN